MLLVGPELNTVGRKLHRRRTYAVGNHIGYSEYPLHHLRKLLAHIHVFPVTRSRTSYLLRQTILINFGLLFRGPGMRYLDMIILPFPICYPFLCRLPLVSDKHVVPSGYQFIPLIPILESLIFKDCSAGEPTRLDVKANELARRPYPIIHIYGPQELPI